MTDDINNRLIYFDCLNTYIVHYIDSGQVIPKAKVEKAMANLADPRIISNSGVTYVRTEELPKELQPSSNTGKGEAKQGSEKGENLTTI